MKVISAALLLCAGLFPAGQVLAQPAADQTRARGGDWNAPQTLAEFQARYRERILRADTDRDGRVSLAEWAAAHPPRDSGDGDGGDGQGSGGQGGGGRRWRDPAREFQLLDADHDGFVTVAEINAASAARFARMDANHDGVVTPDERMATRHGGGGGGGRDEGVPPPQ